MAASDCARDNLRFAPIPRDRKLKAVRSVDEFTEHHRTAGKARELLALTRARCVFTSGDAHIATRFYRAREEVLIHGAARNRLLAGLRKPIGDAPAPGLSSIPLSYQERRIYHFHEYVDRRIGPERIPERLRVEPRLSKLEEDGLGRLKKLVESGG